MIADELRWGVWRWLGPAAAIALAACGATAIDFETAKAATYGGDFETVFQATRDAVASQYRHVVATRRAGTIATPWEETETENRHGPRGPSARRSLKRSFVRFEIAITGGPPWQVDVRGYASVWELGAGRPYVFAAHEEPDWLETRTNSLILAIHLRLQSCCRVK